MSETQDVGGSSSSQTLLMQADVPSSTPEVYKAAVVSPEELTGS
jgi:hypothetical protein